MRVQGHLITSSNKDKERHRNCVYSDNSLLHPYNGNQRYRVEGCGGSHGRHEVFRSQRNDMPCRGSGQQKEDVSRTGDKMQSRARTQKAGAITIRTDRHRDKKPSVRLRCWKNCRVSKSSSALTAEHVPCPSPLSGGAHQPRAPTGRLLDALGDVLIRLSFCMRASLMAQTVRKSACSAINPGSIPGSGGSPGEGNGYPLQYSCLENAMGRGAWWATVCAVIKSGT